MIKLKNDNRDKKYYIYLLSDIYNNTLKYTKFNIPLKFLNEAKTKYLNLGKKKLLSTHCPKSGSDTAKNTSKRISFI